MPSKHSRSIKPHPLTHLFASRSLTDVLGVLLLHPDRELYQRELAGEAGCTVLQAQRALRRIEKARLLIKRRSGNRVYYRIAEQHPGFEDLRSLWAQSIGLASLLRAALRPLRDRITAAFIFGPVAAGADTASGDVDILLIGDVSLRQFSRIRTSAGRQIGRDLSTLIYSPAQFRAKARRGTRFVRELLAGPKIWLVGSEEQLPPLDLR
ncbi:MAG: hypothetical protein GF330_13835 [Candidatus Eisenbacteria bacterium]|nr:hypothetical protein [Candidatus Eisenbacteria bacterium]